MPVLPSIASCRTVPATAHAGCAGLGRQCAPCGRLLPVGRGAWVDGVAEEHEEARFERHESRDQIREVERQLRQKSRLQRELFGVLSFF